MKQVIAFAALCLLSIQTVLSAEESDSVEEVKAALSSIIPANVKVLEIKPGPMQGVYEVKLSGGQEMYVSADGKFLMVGEIYDTERRVNLAEERKAKQMVAKISEVPHDQMIVFGPEDAQRYVTVFTDIDCGYCRKLHKEMPILNEAGLQVRYLMFPRAGLNSKSYKTAVSAWCANDKQEALTMAKLGQAIEELECSNPIADQYKLGQQVGVRGTPTMIFDDGSVVPGYLPHKQLLARVSLASQN